MANSLQRLLSFVEVLDPLRNVHRLSKAGVAGLLKSIPLDQCQVERYAEFSRIRPYGRRVLLSTSNFEVLLMTFSPGRECPPHDHGASEGLMLVCLGVAEHRIYRREAGNLKLVQATRKPAESILEAPVGCIHAMGNGSTTERLVTLHVYWPLIQQMSIFDVLKRKVYVVNEEAGAWLPPDPATLLACHDLK